MRRFRDRPRDYRELVWRELIANDITQYRLAQISGLGPSTINRIVNGVRAPTEAEVLRIAAAFLLTAEQKAGFNQHLDNADFYTIPSEAIGRFPNGAAGDHGRADSHDKDRRGGEYRRPSRLGDDGRPGRAADGDADEDGDEYGGHGVLLPRG